MGQKRVGHEREKIPLALVPPDGKKVRGTRIRRAMYAKDMGNDTGMKRHRCVKHGGRRSGQRGPSGLQPKI